MKKKLLIPAFIFCTLLSYAAESTAVFIDTDNAAGREAFAERERRANALIAKIDAFVAAGGAQAPQEGLAALTAGSARESGYRELILEMYSHFDSYPPFALAVNTSINAERTNVRYSNDPEEMAVINFQMKIMPVDSAYAIMWALYQGMNREFGRVTMDRRAAQNYLLGFRAVVTNGQGKEIGVVERVRVSSAREDRIVITPRFADASANSYPMNFSVRNETARVALHDIIEPISIQFTEIALTSPPNINQTIRAAGGAGEGWVWASGASSAGSVDGRPANGFFEVFAENFSSWTHPDYELTIISRNTAMITGAKIVSREINIPAQVAGRGNIVIGREAFQNRVITQLTIPPSVTVIDDRAFSIHIPGDATPPPCFERLILPSGLLRLGQNAFQGRRRITELTIPDSVQTMGTGVFSSCTSLSEVVIGRGLRSIPSGTFSNTALRNVSIPDNIETIGSNAFRNINSGRAGPLQSVTFGRGIKEIRDNAFYNQGLRSIEIPDNVRLGSDVFSGETRIGANVFDRIALGRNVVLISREDRFGFNIADGGRITIPAGLESFPTLNVPGAGDSTASLRGLYEQTGRQAGTYEVSVSARGWREIR